MYSAPAAPPPPPAARPPAVAPPGPAGWAIASCARTLAGPTIGRRVASPRIQLLPAGAFRALDGRPTEVDAWQLDAAAGAALVAAAAARRTPYVLDYEHQSLHTTGQGIKAPAAGWFKTLEWVDDDGLYATDVAWTDAARALIEADEYRYLSPVFAWERASGRVTALINAALTNLPGLDGLSGVADRIAARLALDPAGALATPPGAPMDELLERLRYFLNLPITATAVEVSAELQKLIDRLAGDGLANAGEVAARLAAGAAETAALKSELASARAAADPTAAVPFAVHAALTQQLAGLQAQIEQRERADLIAAALADGRLLSPTLPYWQEQPLAALTAYLKHASPIAALGGQQSTHTRPAADAPAAAGPFPVPAGYRVDAARLAHHQRALALMREQQVSYAVAAAATLAADA